MRELNANAVSDAYRIGLGRLMAACEKKSRTECLVLGIAWGRWYDRTYRNPWYRSFGIVI